MNKSELLTKPIYYLNAKTKKDDTAITCKPLLYKFFLSPSFSDNEFIHCSHKQEITEHHNFTKLKNILFNENEEETVDFINYYIRPNIVNNILSALSITYPGLGLLNISDDTVLTFYRVADSGKLCCKIELKKSSINYINENTSQSEILDFQLTIVIECLGKNFLLDYLYSHANLEIKNLIFSNKNRNEINKLLFYETLNLEVKKKLKAKLEKISEIIHGIQDQHTQLHGINHWLKTVKDSYCSLFSLDDLHINESLADTILLFLGDKKFNRDKKIHILEILLILIKNNTFEENDLKLNPITLFNKTSGSIKAERAEFIDKFKAYIKTGAYPELDAFLTSQKKIGGQNYPTRDSEEIRKKTFSLLRDEKQIYIDLINSILTTFEFKEKIKTHIENFLKSIDLSHLSYKILHNFLFVIYNYRLSLEKEKTLLFLDKINFFNKAITSGYSNFKLEYSNKLGAQIEPAFNEFTLIAADNRPFDFVLKKKEKIIQDAYADFEKVIIDDHSLEIPAKEKLLISIQKLIYEINDSPISIPVTHYKIPKSHPSSNTIDSPDCPIFLQIEPCESKYFDIYTADKAIASENEKDFIVKIDNKDPIENKRNIRMLFYDKNDSLEAEECLIKAKEILEYSLITNIKENNSDHDYSFKKFFDNLKKISINSSNPEKINNFFVDFFEQFCSINKNKPLITIIKEYINYHYDLTVKVDEYNDFYYFERSRSGTSQYFIREKKFKNINNLQSNFYTENSLEGLAIAKLNNILKDIVLSEFELFFNGVTQKDSYLLDRSDSLKNTNKGGSNPQTQLTKRKETECPDIDFKVTFSRFLQSTLGETTVEINFLNEKINLFTDFYPRKFIDRVKQGILFSSKRLSKLKDDILLSINHNENYYYKKQIVEFLRKEPWYKLFFKYGIFCLPWQAKKIADGPITKYLLSAIYKEKLSQINEMKATLIKRLDNNLQIVTLEENQNLASYLVELNKAIILLEENLSLEKKSDSFRRRNLAEEFSRRINSGKIKGLLSKAALFTRPQQFYWEEHILHHQQSRLEQTIEELQRKKEISFKKLEALLKNSAAKLTNLTSKKQTINPPSISHTDFFDVFQAHQAATESPLSSTTTIKNAIHPST